MSAAETSHTLVTQEPGHPRGDATLCDSRKRPTPQAPHTSTDERAPFATRPQGLGKHAHLVYPVPFTADTGGPRPVRLHG